MEGFFYLISFPLRVKGSAAAGIEEVKAVLWLDFCLPRV